MTTDTNTNKLDTLHSATDGLLSIDYSTGAPHGILVTVMADRSRDMVPLSAPLHCHEMRAVVLQKLVAAKKGRSDNLGSTWNTLKYLDRIADEHHEDDSDPAPLVTGSFESAHSGKLRRVHSFGPTPVIRRPIAG